MTLLVTRTGVRLNPDYKKVIPRFFNTGNERSRVIINKVVNIEDKEVEALLGDVLNEFSSRYKNIHTIFLKHFDLVRYLLTPQEKETISEAKTLLIGSYFTMEYALEAAALFNPSIVEHPNQNGVIEGQKKVIVSFRATGESHISSLVFKQGVLDERGLIRFAPSSRFISEGAITEKKKGSKADFESIFSQMSLPEGILPKILHELTDSFSYKEIENALKKAMIDVSPVNRRKKMKYDILSRVNTSYELDFSHVPDLSERIIFPVTITEKNGIEDARFVKFTEEDGSFVYIATYTAYDGTFILPQLIITQDFSHFKIRPLHGKTAVNKNLALFPRKVNGKYVMLSRIDGINNYIMFSDDLYLWEEAQLLQQPKYPWEYVQVGNAGSPIETEKGWLIITHGVGPMRKYCLGASLFDINDPTIELGRLKAPLLVPNEDERDGYVPNVVYSCGAIIHGEKLLIPYAVSDYASSFATVPVKDLLNEILKK